VFDRVRDRAGMNHDFSNNKSLDFWLFDFYVAFGFIISFNSASHGATLRTKLLQICAITYSQMCDKKMRHKKSKQILELLICFFNHGFIKPSSPAKHGL
jgi:hypothetical protein